MSGAPADEAHAPAGPVTPSLGAIGLAMVSVQIGASFAKGLFPVVGALGATSLRVFLSAVMLVTILRPWRRPPPRRAWPALLGYGLSLGAMNLTFYTALRTVPLGLTVALEFTGPLVLSLVLSRRGIDLLFVVIAALGILLLSPIGGPVGAVDPFGVALALCAGGLWALYIVFGQRAGVATGTGATAIGAVIAALLVCPIGLTTVGPGFFVPHVLLTATLVAFLSSAVPYSLEMIALTRLPARVFGTLMSAEPAVAAVAGWAILHETLGIRQIIAVGAIVLASLGTALSARVSVTKDPT